MYNKFWNWLADYFMYRVCLERGNLDGIALSYHCQDIKNKLYKPGSLIKYYIHLKKEF